MTTMRRFTAFVLACLGLVTTSLADLNSHDRKFVREAAMAGVFEIEANRLGIVRATNAEVKQHSKHMVTDHMKAGQELTRLARKEGIRPPTAMNGNQRAIVSKLRRLRGASFDREHARTQLKAHQDAVALFNSQIKNGKDRQLVRWAKQTLPKLEEHRHMWERAYSEFTTRRTVIPR